ncbi:hypothetical protein TTHERM_01312310, partial (macronuclear) [Tetrahymena thermophila SB210]
MKLYLLTILLSQYLSLIICSCNQENQCFDQKQQKCKLVDGKEHIGKEKRYGYCVIDAIKYEFIDFCKSDYEPVCISQDRKSCIKVQNSDHIVAILYSGNLCSGVNEFTSNFNSPQKLKYIKQGFCQDFNGRIKLGQAVQSASQQFLCNNLEGGQFNKCRQKKSCYLVGKNKCLNLNEVDGITSDGFCVFQNELYFDKIYCNESLCQIKNSQEQYSCISYSNSDIAGKTGDNYCIYQGQYFPKETLINCKQQYCIFQDDEQKSCLKIDRTNNPQIYGVSEEGFCLIQIKKKKISFILQQNTCPQSYCYFQDSCVQLSSQNPAKLNDSTCASLNTQNSVQCFTQLPACLSSSSTCLEVSSSSPNSVGLRTNGECAVANQYYSDLQSCSQDYCIKQSSGKKGCFVLDGSENAIGIDQSGNCVDSKTVAISCFDSDDICKDSQTSKCTKINSNSTFSNICILNGICYQMSYNQYVGRDTQYQCLKNQQESDQKILNCYSNTYQICKRSDLLACINYTSDSTYLGYISSTGICAQFGVQISTSGFQSITNLNPNYCQDDSYKIQLIVPVYAGRDQLYSRCLKPDQTQYQKVELCAKDYCIANSSCKMIGFDGVLIAKLSNGQCAQAQQSQSVQCAFKNYNYCLLNQTCNLLSSSNQSFSGIDSYGNCLSRNQSVFSSSLFKCADNHCKYSTGFEKQGCYLLDGSVGLAGSDSSQICLDYNKKQATQCAQQPIVCFDSNTQTCQQTVNYGSVGNGCSLNGQCFQMSPQFYVGRDTNNQCFKINNTPLSGTVDKCFNDPQTICLTSDKKQCIIYTNSSQYLGYIQSTGICAQNGQKTSNQALQIIVNLDKGYCQDNQFRIQQLLPPYVGRDSVNQLCLQQSTQSSQIEFCVQGYCVANNKCQPVGFDKKLIAKLSNQQCGLDQIPTAIECAFQSLDGQDISGNCVKRGQLTQNGSTNQVGIAANGLCLDINQAPAIRCTDQVNYICYDTNSQTCIQINTSSTNNYCKYQGTCYQLNLNQYVGRDTNFNCLTSGKTPTTGLVQNCLYDPQNICQKSDQSQCIYYTNKQWKNTYLGFINSSGYCAQEDQATSSLQFEIITNLDSNYCQDDSFFIRKIQTSYGGREVQYQRCLKAFNLPISQIDFCSKGYCIQSNECKQIGFDGKLISKLQNGQCAIDRQYPAVECAYNTLDTCLYNNMCYWLTEQDAFASGIDQNGNCLTRGVFSIIFKKCQSNHCFKIYPNFQSSQDGKGCFLLDGSQGQAGITSLGQCLAINTSPACRCTNKTNSICYDPATQTCQNTINYGSIGKGCILNSQCYQFSIQQYIGRDLELQCLVNNQITSQVDICFNEVNDVCLTNNDYQQFCVLYPQSQKYLGYISENKRCAIQDQIAYQNGILANLVNLKANFCQDVNGYIRALNKTQYVGVSKQNYQCLTVKQTSTNNIIQCYSGFCLNVNFCQAYDDTYIGKASNQTCLKVGQPQSIECAVNYCIEPNTQSCMLINDNDPNLSGVQGDYKCAVLGQYYTQILQCSSKYCIDYQDPDDPTTQPGCFLWDASIQRIGIDKNGYCTYQDQPNAIKCMPGQFCLNTLFGNSCQSLLLSFDQNRFSRERITGICLPYLDPKYIQGGDIETCVDGSCFYIDQVQKKNFCLSQGIYALGDFIVGIDTLGQCLIKNQITRVCLTYCALDIG